MKPTRHARGHNGAERRVTAFGPTRPAFSGSPYSSSPRRSGWLHQPDMREGTAVRSVGLRPLAQPDLRVYASRKKIDSIGSVNTAPILNANGKLGSYLPVSMALTV